MEDFIMSINVSKIDFSIEQIVGDSDPTLVLLGVSPVFKYIGQEKTDEVIGTKLDVILPDGEYHRFNVTVPIVNSPISPEDFQRKKDSGQPIFCKLVNSKCRLYVDRNSTIQVSVKADNIILLD